LRSGAAWVDGPPGARLVFDRGNGNWLSPTSARGNFDCSVEKAKVTKLTPHGMRHSMATLLLATGVHPKVVQERLGHSWIQMKLDLYSHVSATMQQDAADILDQLLGDGARPKRGHDAG
jgi:integrase